MLPNDVYHEILNHTDFKTYYHFCNTNKQNKLKCNLKKKLEQTIEIPLDHYTQSQINKLSNMVYRGSFRQDIVLSQSFSAIFFIDDEGNLIKTKSYNSDFKKINGPFTKIISSIQRRNSQILLLKEGNLWSYLKEEIDYGEYEEKLEQITFTNDIIDIATYVGTSTVFLSLLYNNGDIFITVKEDPIKSQNKYYHIGNIKNAIKVILGSNHVIVLDNNGDVYFFSHAFRYQIPSELIQIDDKNIVELTKIENNVKQVIVDDYDATLCLKYDGTIIKITTIGIKTLDINYHVVHMCINKNIFVVLDNYGNLYQKRHHDFKLIGKNVCNMAVDKGHTDDVVMINHEGVYTLGNSNWKGQWQSMPYTEPLLFDYTPI